MDTKEHTNTYIVLILISLLVEVTRVAGSATEIIIFLLFVLYEFFRFALESGSFKNRKLAPIPVTTNNPTKERKAKND